MKFSLKQFFHTKKNLLFVLASSLLFILVFILDLAFYSRTTIPTNIYWTREGMVVIAASLLGFMVYRRHLEGEKNLVYILKTFFFSILGLYIAVIVPGLIIKTDFFAFSQNYVEFLNLFQEILRNALLSIFVTLFLVINLFWLKDLIFYKGRRGTHRLFNIVIILLFVYIIYGHYSHKILQTNWSFQGLNPTEWVFAGLIIIIMLILSFRTSWVNYLNKRQKILTFWGGVLIIPGAILFLESNSLETILKYSFTLGTFDTFAAYFLGIYLIAGEVSLMLHLPTASIFDKKMNEISSLQNLSRVISSVLDYDEVISRVTKLAQDVLKSDSCWLEMIQNNEELKIVSSRDLAENEIDNMLLSKEDGISGWVIKNRKSILVNEIDKDSRTVYLRNLRKNIGSILGVPLLSQKGVIGILYTIKNDIYGFDQDDREMLQAFANQATVAIENARLVKESIEKERLEQELRVAHDTQVKLLPKEMPRVTGLQVDAYCITAYEVGGDYYDFIQFDDGKLGIVIADVSGKGLSAAFYMAELKGIVTAFSRLYDSPKQLLQKVNETLYQNVDRKTFVSMIYAIFDVKKKKMTYCRAGHCPLLYYDKKHNKITLLKPDGIGIALDPGNIFNRTIQEDEIRWHDDDLFLFFTDGLTEARNNHREEYSEERILKIIEKIPDRSIEEIRQTVMDDVSKFIGTAKTHDDLSLVSIKIEGKYN